MCFPHPQDINDNPLRDQTHGRNTGTDKDVTFGNSCMNSPTKNGLDYVKLEFLS